jgi:hypothetical protein
MSKVKTAAKIAGKSSSGGISSSFLIGSIVAWCTNPTFVGWGGFAKSLVVGLGTSIGSGIGLVAGIISGGAVGALLGGLLFRSKKAALVGGIGFAAVGALGGDIAGAVKGYNTVESWILAKDKANAKVVFNDNAAKQNVSNSKTLVLTAKSFQLKKAA